MIESSHYESMCCALVPKLALQYNCIDFDDDLFKIDRYKFVCSAMNEEIPSTWQEIQQLSLFEPMKHVVVHVYPAGTLEMNIYVVFQAEMNKPRLDFEKPGYESDPEKPLWRAWRHRKSSPGADDEKLVQDRYDIQQGLMACSIEAKMYESGCLGAGPWFVNVIGDPWRPYKVVLVHCSRPASLASDS